MRQTCNIEEQTPEATKKIFGQNFQDKDSSHVYNAEHNLVRKVGTLKSMLNLKSNLT